MKKYKYHSKYSNVSDEYFLAKLKEAAILLGGFVTEQSLNKLKDFPNRWIIEKRFGRWSNALKLANLPIKPSWPTGKPKNNKRTFHLKLRFRILERDNFTCQYCGRTPQDGAKLVIDHIIPFSKDGKTISENLITSCFECNAGKGDIVLGKKKELNEDERPSSS